MANATSHHDPLGWSLHLIAKEAVETFLHETEKHFKYLEDILQEARAKFGRRESTLLLPKTPCTKRKRRPTRRTVEQNNENTDPALSTEDEQETKKKVKIDEPPVCTLPLQAICENEVLNTSSVVEDTCRKTRSRAAKGNIKSQPSQQPKRSTRRSRKQALEEAEVALENTCAEEEESRPQRVTRSRRKNSTKVSMAKSPTATAVTEPVVSSEAAGGTVERQCLVDKSTDNNEPKEQFTKIVVPADSTTGPKSRDRSLEDRESTKNSKLSAEGKRKSLDRHESVSETSEVPSQSNPSPKKACRPSVTVVLEPVDVQHLTPTQADQTGDSGSEEVTVTTSPIPEKNEEDNVLSEAKDAKKRKKTLETESDSNVSSTVKTRRLERVSKKCAVQEVKESVEASTMAEELACPQEVEQKNIQDDTEDSKSQPAVSSTVKLPLEAQPESNKCNTRNRRSRQMSSKASHPRALAKPKSDQKTHSLVKSSVTMTLTRTPLMLASEKHASEKQNSSPEELSDDKVSPDLGDLRQNLFGDFQGGSDSDKKSDSSSSSSSQSAGLTSSQSTDEQRPIMGSGSGSDDVDGQGYAASQEEDEDDNEENVFHDAVEELEEAKTKGVDAALVSPSSSEQSAKSALKVESGEEIESIPENEIQVAAGPKEGKPINLVTIHSFIKRDTPKKANLEDEKKKRVIALKKKQEKENERIELLEIQKQKEAEEKKRKREERAKKVAELRAEKAKREEERRQRMQERFEQKKCADEKAKKRREKEEDAKKKLRQQKKADLDARRKQEEESRKQRLLEQEEEAKRQRELVQMKLGFEEQERQRKIAEMKRQQETREKELDRERELEKLRRLKEIEEKEKKVREKEERERQEKAKKAAEEKEKKAREKEEREREEKARKAAEENEKMQRKVREAEEKLEKERIRITKLIREKEEQQRLEKLRQENEKRLREAREAERKRQEEIKRREAAEKQRKAAEQSRQAVAVVDSYEMTPPPPPKSRKASSKDNYDITDLCSDDSTDDEEAPRKKVPLWAQGNALWATLLNQQMSSSIDVDEIFGSVSSPNLEDIFKHKRKRFYQRTSSACWDSPPRKVKVHGTQV